MKKDEKFNKLIVIIFILSLVGIIVFVYLPDFFIMPNLSTSGFVPINVEVDATGDTGTVTLTGGCYQVIATVEKDQAISMINGMNKVVGVRPNSHDLFRDTLTVLDAKILMIKITDVREQSYISKLIIKQGNKFLNLDSRPSDAIAVALRMDYKIPIYMNQSLLKEQGTKIC